MGCFDRIDDLFVRTWRPTVAALTIGMFLQIFRFKICAYARRWYRRAAITLSGVFLSREIRVFELGHLIFVLTQSGRFLQFT